jgi:hypothetical protein
MFFIRFVFAFIGCHIYFNCCTKNRLFLSTRPESEAKTLVMSMFTSENHVSQNNFSAWKPVPAWDLLLKWEAVFHFRKLPELGNQDDRN